MSKTAAADKTKRTPLEVGPKMEQPTKPKAIFKTNKTEGWCKFRAKGSCTIEDALLETSEQEITLSPAGSYRARNNRNLELIEGTIPEMPEDAPKRPGKEGTREDREAFAEYERAFIESLNDGDPIVGPAPQPFRLIKQG